MKPHSGRAILTASLTAFWSCAMAHAQDAPRRLGVFSWHDSPNDRTTLAGIRAGLEAARLRCEFVERSADSDRERGLKMLDELAGCELVFAMGTQAALLAKERIHDRPVVFAAVSDPVASGVVGSWEASASNLAGSSNWIAPESILRTFQRAVPGLEKLGMLRSRDAGVVSAAELRNLRQHLDQTRTRITVVEAVTADAAGIGAAVQSLLAQDVQAIWIPIDLTIYQNMPAVLAALGARPVPLVTTAMQASRSGASVAVIVDYRLLGQRTAALALDILAGRTVPGAAPVVTLRSYQVVVNLAAARLCGYRLPLSLLELADVLIDEDPAR
jgi:putative ABC transport system substrate-binding protein